MNRQWLLLALVCAAGPALAAQAQVYKWTDANGVVHYTDTPPPKEAQNVQNMRVSGGDRARPTADAADAQNAPKPADNAPPLPPPGENAQAQKDAETLAKYCQTARSNLEVLQGKGPVTTTGADGKEKLLDDSARQLQISTANAQVARYCKQ